MTDTKQPYSFASFIGFLSGNFVVLLIAGIFFIGGFLAGSMWTENQMLKSGKTGTGTALPATDPNAVPTGPTVDQLSQVPPLTDDDYVRGNRDAKVVLYEYSDLECPFCATFHPTMVQIMEEYGDQIAWVYRHYPLPFHPNAQKAAEAAECVVDQQGNDAFWTFADRMFEEQDKLGGKLNADTAATVAEELGVNMTTFNECVESGKFADKVTEMMSAGSTAGISGTPGTILMTEDGQVELINGAYPIDQVKATIDKYL